MSNSLKRDIWNQCQFCGDSLKNIQEEGEILHMDCRACGKYSIPLQDHQSRKELNIENKRYIISAILRNANKNGKIIEINRDNVKDLLASASLPNGPLDIIDRLLVYIYDHSRSSASFVEINWDYDYPLFYAQDKKELSYLSLQAKNMGYVETNPSKGGNYRLTLNGWQRVDELRRKKIESRQAFVAMWFSDDMKSAWDNGFKPALEETGYQPIRIDLVQHNMKIDDKIIAEIRKSGLLVADFTGNRGGVYFEAGFAMGLGIPVIWTCRKDDINNLHFDTRQYNHIDWETPEELKEKLINRINATVPIKS